jgi:hypothetical protein
MNAIVPINIAAVRVSNVDYSSVTNNFKGRTAVFNKLSYKPRPGEHLASTGEKIFRPLENQNDAENKLGTGIHLHWELPDYFRRGIQAREDAGSFLPPSLKRKLTGADGGNVVFPDAPDRWLITRFLSEWDDKAGIYGPVKIKRFIVESDFLSPVMLKDADRTEREATPVPVNYTGTDGIVQPFMFMGRVLDYESWSPSAESPADFLPAHKDSDGNKLSLTSVGFTGPGFSAYYPECNSVFGFWDRFLDQPDIYDRINQNKPVQFKVSYQVTGWLNDPASDPLSDIESLVKNQYNDLLAKYNRENVKLDKTPAEVFENIMEKGFRWSFTSSEIGYTLNSDNSFGSIDAPAQTLCCGIVQEIIWNMKDNVSSPSFLSANPGNNFSSVWTDDSVKVAVGNSTTEALAALLKSDLGSKGNNDPDLHNNFEYLLNAFQLGLLNMLENDTNNIFDLDETIHSNGYEKSSGGKLWVVRLLQPDDRSVPHDSDREITLPLTIAEQLSLLNQAQKQYDQGRAALDTVRKQLFMDWLRYVKLQVKEADSSVIDYTAMADFIGTATSGGALKEAIKLGSKVGVLNYSCNNKTGEITGIAKAPASSDSYASSVYQNFLTVSSAVKANKGWELAVAPAPAFYAPADPVVVMEGDKIVPVRRNGSDITPVRLSTDLITKLNITVNGKLFSVTGDKLTGLPVVSAQQPMVSEIKGLWAEACFLVPMLGTFVADAIKGQGGDNNPGGSNYNDFVNTLNGAQGGLSPLESAVKGGLFETIRAAGYLPAPDPSVAVSAPLKADFVFTGSAGSGWLPAPSGWNAQQAEPHLSNSRMDPFLPVWLIWSVRLKPLKRNNNPEYTALNLTDYFGLDSNAIDYEYHLNNNAPVNFTIGNFVTYTGSVALSRRPAISLTGQIQNYIKNNPEDRDRDKLNQAAAAYAARNFISQGLDSFNLQQLLRNYIPQIPVQNLTKTKRDDITDALDLAARTANPEDNWYDFAFNSLAPIAEGLQGQENFGPLRSGFFEISSLEIVDVFGQRLQVHTASSTPDKTLEIIPAFTVQPVSGDTASKGLVYLPPRILEPTRLWFRWLSAEHNNEVAGISDDFIEMNTHSSTSPVTGWVIPNHLENSLFFYDSDGTPIGSIRTAHGNLQYNSRAGKSGNDFEKDVADVNVHTANFMRFILNSKNPLLLQDLMTSLLESDRFMQSPAFARDAGLAVFLGRPLAITRAQIALETKGYVLPVSQSDAGPEDAFPQDVQNHRVVYADRQAAGSAALESVSFPVRLGNLPKANDGLVGFMIENGTASPYDIFYTPAGPDNGKNLVVKPSPDTLKLKLNDDPVVITMLMDPRSAVHATTGLLPVEGLQIPADQYGQTLKKLAVTFFTHPVLQERQGLVLPLPAETGYQWSWVDTSTALTGPVTLKAQAGDDNAVYDYSPQTLLEGWLRLGEEEENG